MDSVQSGVIAGRLQACRCPWLFQIGIDLVTIQRPCAIDTERGMEPVRFRLDSAPKTFGPIGGPATIR